MTAIEMSTAELNRLFALFNEHYFDNEIETPVITIQTNGHKKLTMGWCTVRKVWAEKGGDNSYYEICICAEYLSRDINGICATLLHEMVHLYNQQRGVNDCSRGNSYHNKVFRDTAQARGLIIGYTHKYGWTTTTLNSEAVEFIKENANEDAFAIARTTPFYLGKPKGGKNGDGGEGGDGETQKPKTSTRRYVCPKCGAIVRATKELNIICGDCSVKFIQEEK